MGSSISSSSSASKLSRNAATALQGNLDTTPTATTRNILRRLFPMGNCRYGCCLLVFLFLLCLGWLCYDHIHDDDDKPLSSSFALNPIEIRGYKFFDTVTGDEFRIRGIDYYPRPNQGDGNHNSLDYFTERHRSIWERDIPYLQALGVNAIRIYAINATYNHDAFFCALERAGIYVMVELAHDCPTCAITKDKSPTCYPPQLKQIGQNVIRHMSRYTNVIAFSAGNEVNHFAPPGQPEYNAPCQKKFLRDMRAYIQDTCRNEIRHVPIGLVAADSDRDVNALYYNCQTSSSSSSTTKTTTSTTTTSNNSVNSNESINPNHRPILNDNMNDNDDDDDPYETAEWLGLNSYVNCDGHAQTYAQALGLQTLQASFASYNYSIPVVLTEFGCLSDTFPTIKEYEAQRNFYQAYWMHAEPHVRDQFAGGFVFEYSMEMENAKSESPFPFTKFGNANYGIGYLEPENCDDITIPCLYHPLPSYEKLRQAYLAVLDPTNITLSSETTNNQSSSFILPVNLTTTTQMITTLSNFEIPIARQGRGTCPSNFPSIQDFVWEADQVPDLSCHVENNHMGWMFPLRRRRRRPKQQQQQSESPTSPKTFVCPANLDDLRPVKKSSSSLVFPYFGGRNNHHRHNDFEEDEPSSPRSLYAYVYIVTIVMIFSIVTIGCSMFGSMVLNYVSPQSSSSSTQSFFPLSSSVANTTTTKTKAAPILNNNNNNNKVVEYDDDDDDDEQGKTKDEGFSSIKLLPWSFLTMVVPKLRRGDGNKASSESMGLLSMSDIPQGGDYQAIDSDTSLEEN